MIAYATFVHSLDLVECLYMTEMKKHSVVENPFIATVSFETIHDWCTTGKSDQEIEDYLQKYTEATNLPDFLKNIDFHPEWQFPNIPNIKRFPLVEDLNSNDQITDESYFEQVGMYGRLHGVVMSRKYLPQYMDEQVNEFEEHYEEYNAMQISKSFRNMTSSAATTTSSNDNKAPNSPTLNSQRKAAVFISPKHPKHAPTTSPRGDLHGQGNNNNNNNKNNNKQANEQEENDAELAQILNCQQNDATNTGYTIHMNTVAIMKHFGVMSFQRGRDYEADNRISQLKVKPISQTAFKLYSLCQGSREDPYKEETIVKSGRLIKSGCTCPIGENGKCKHVCAQVMAYMKKLEQMKKQQAKKANGGKEEQQQESSESKKAEESSEPKIMPFKQISPEKDWAVEMQITHKNNVRVWSNERGSGTVGSITARDCNSNDDIRVVMFSEILDKYWDDLHIDAKYLVCKAHLRYRNPSYEDRSISSEIPFEIHLTEKSIVKRLDESKPLSMKEVMKQALSPSKNKQEASKSNGNEEIKQESKEKAAFHERAIAVAGAAKTSSNNIIAQAIEFQPFIQETQHPQQQQQQQLAKNEGAVDHVLSQVLSQGGTIGVPLRTASQDIEARFNALLESVDDDTALVKHEEKRVTSVPAPHEAAPEQEQQQAKSKLLANVQQLQDTAANTSTSSPKKRLSSSMENIFFGPSSKRQRQRKSNVEPEQKKTIEQIAQPTTVLQVKQQESIPQTNHAPHIPVEIISIEESPEKKRMIAQPPTAAVQQQEQQTKKQEDDYTMIIDDDEEEDEQKHETKPANKEANNLAMEEVDEPEETVVDDYSQHSEYSMNQRRLQQQQFQFENSNVNKKTQEVEETIIDDDEEPPVQQEKQDLLKQPQQQEQVLTAPMTEETNCTAIDNANNTCTIIDDGDLTRDDDEVIELHTSSPQQHHATNPTEIPAPVAATMVQPPQLEEHDNNNTTSAILASARKTPPQKISMKELLSKSTMMQQAHNKQ